MLEARASLRNRCEPELLSGSSVTANYFDVLGVKPAMGRGFVAEDTGGPEVMLISDALWSRRFGRDPRILGRQLRIRDSLRTVVGIMPADFYEPELGGRVPRKCGACCTHATWRRSADPTSCG